MEYTTLGNTGMTVSKICLGCMSFGSSDWREWVLDEDESEEIIDKAVDLGINFFDTANMYSVGESERVVGNALSGYDRDWLVLATKVFNPMDEDNPNAQGLSRKAIEQELQNSLDRLGMDTIDLYQTHRWDYDAPIEETLTNPRRRRPTKSGALHRRLVDVGPPVRGGPPHQRPPEPRTVRHDAEPLQPRLPRGGARDAPAL